MADESRPRGAKSGAPPWQQEGTPGDGFGASLRKHRRGLEISLQQISEHTRISESILEAIEEDRDDLPAPVFVRGYLRQYARYVGLDPDQVVSQYAGGRTGQERDPVQTGAVDSDADLGAWVWVAAGVLTVAVSAGYWFYGRSATSNDPRASASGAIASPAGETSGAADRQIDEAQQGPQAAPPSDNEVAVESTVDLQTGELGEPGSADDLNSPTAGATPLQVTIDFVEDCWVESTVDGVRQISTLYAKGESLRLEAESEMRVFLGNYTGAVVQINGRQYDWPVGEQGDATRELNIDAEFVAALGGAVPEPRAGDALGPAQFGVGEGASERDHAQAPLA